MKPILFALVLSLGLAPLAACGGGDASESAASSGSEADAAQPTAPAEDLPVSSVDVGPIDAAMADAGKSAFETRCMTCHKLDERYIGPPLGDVAGRRDPVWIMNMILAPEQMLKSDAEVQALYAEYNVPMTNQNLTEEEARSILEYLRQHNEGA